jgi:hypothetical protein
MAHVSKRPKELWTGVLPDGAQERGPEDDRICWHVRMPWGAQPSFRADLLKLMQAESEEKPMSEQPEEVRVRFWELVSRYVTGWSNVTDAEGNPVPFTLDEFLQVDVAHTTELFMGLGKQGQQVRGN